MRICKKSGVLFIVITFLLLFPTSTLALQSSIDFVDYRHTPYVDRVVYKKCGYGWYYDMLNDEIDLFLGFYDEFNSLMLEPDPDIDLYQAPGNAYWCIKINCDSRAYPLNISGFRRAFAYAFDKSRVTTEIFEGLVSPHDSIIPQTSSFCIEEELQWNYYSNQTDIGNQILDDLGFHIDPDTGWRDDPNGNSFEIEIWYRSRPIADQIAQIGADALNELHVRTAVSLAPFNYSPDHYEMMVRNCNFRSNDVDWLGDDIWGEFSGPGAQIPHYFSNTSFDLAIEELLQGVSYNDVFDAAAEIQRIVHYNVPRLVVCPRVFLQPYRTTTFDGHIQDVTRGVSGPWSLCNVRNNSGTMGGTVRIGYIDYISHPNYPYVPQYFNFYVTNTLFTNAYFENLLPTLYSIGPELELIPNLAESVTIETHSDNVAVPEGHTRLTFDIVSNATWADGVPVTAQDVVLTSMYELESGIYGNPAAQELEDLIAAYAPTPTRAVVEFRTESYWHLSNYATRKVIPKHIFNNIDGIGCEEWYTWNPIIDETDPIITCGPFNIGNYVVGDWYEIVKNPNYHYNVSEIPEVETTTEPTHNPTNGHPRPLSPVQLLVIGVTMGSTASIIVTGCAIIQHRRLEAHDV